MLTRTGAVHLERARRWRVCGKTKVDARLEQELRIYDTQGVVFFPLRIYHVMM